MNAQCANIKEGADGRKPGVVLMGGRVVCLGCHWFH